MVRCFVSNSTLECNWTIKFDAYLVSNHKGVGLYVVEQNSQNMNCLLSKLGLNWSLVIRQLSHKTEIIGLLFKLLLNETQITTEQNSN